MTASLRLVILDDFYPNPASAFRATEFEALLRHYPISACASVAPDVAAHLGGLARRSSDLSDRVGAYTGIPAGTDLAYVVGLNTAWRFLPDLEASGTPFVIELYPGFGLWLGSPEAEARLAAVLRSPLLRRVIVTQAATRAHVQASGSIAPDAMEEIYGFVTDTAAWHAVSALPRRPSADGTEHLAFVAQKYTAGGRDKGFDVMIAAMRRLIEMGRSVRLHVVGSFDAADADLGPLRPDAEIVFHGTQPARFFPWFYRSIDAIVSPNAAGILGPGAFDGFPTGAVAEAMLCGVAAFVTDPLGQNEHWSTGHDLVLIEREPGDLAAILAAYLDDPVRLSSIATAGRDRARVLFDLDRQMGARIAVLDGAVMRGGGA